MKGLFLDEHSREVTVPIDKNRNNLDKYGMEKCEEEEQKILKEDGRARTYRALTARLHYLGQDRTDIQHAVKELS